MAVSEEVVAVSEEVAVACGACSVWVATDAPGAGLEAGVAVEWIAEGLSPASVVGVLAEGVLVAIAGLATAVACSAVAAVFTDWALSAAVVWIVAVVWAVFVVWVGSPVWVVATVWSDVAVGWAWAAFVGALVVSLPRVPAVGVGRGLSVALGLAVSVVGLVVSVVGLTFSVAGLEGCADFDPAELAVPSVPALLLADSVKCMRLLRMLSERAFRSPSFLNSCCSNAYCSSEIFTLGFSSTVSPFRRRASTKVLMPTLRTFCALFNLIGIRCI